LSPNHKFEFLFAVFRGSQDSACEKKQEQRNVQLLACEDVWRAQSDFLSGDRGLHNLHRAEH
jgi:hypothetical protein